MLRPAARGAGGGRPAAGPVLAHFCGESGDFGRGAGVHVLSRLQAILILSLPVDNLGQHLLPILDDLRITPTPSLVLPNFIFLRTSVTQENTQFFQNSIFSL